MSFICSLSPRQRRQTLLNSTKINSSASFETSQVPVYLFLISVTQFILPRKFEKRKRRQSAIYDTPGWITLQNIQYYEIQLEVVKHEICILILLTGLTTPSRPQIG
jgi:hypothetical protein